MAKRLSISDGASETGALRATADLILGRANSIAVQPAKERALELARIVLRGAPNFGGREMRDAQIIEALEAEQIGAATFKKALSIARKELTKKPSGGSPRRAKRSANQQDTKGSVEPARNRPQRAGAPMAANLDRTLL